ncbi:DUF4236 domain-containing protein [Streptomyces sp. H27-D2]|uniref:DUF4236 domain-containing protein n=1 Tax=Streptomyces sp. H27-D2 TaxID=3046304 RepID=UPI002DC01B70|nr:DUF4236 domain-containing protein [Streptomyces sp. H27-D2]MEC4019224.1 DUF4236 domain-containing protein [Streptomyces sp. H27-D2]
MSVHYHKRVTIIPRLVHLTINGHRWSLEYGSRRAHAVLGSHGRREASVRLPGGFSWHRRSRH